MYGMLGRVVLPSIIENQTHVSHEGTRIMILHSVQSFGDGPADTENMGAGGEERWQKFTFKLASCTVLLPSILCERIQSNTRVRCVPSDGGGVSPNNAAHLTIAHTSAHHTYMPTPPGKKRDKFTVLHQVLQNSTPFTPRQTINERTVFSASLQLLPKVHRSRDDLQVVGAAISCRVHRSSEGCPLLVLDQLHQRLPATQRGASTPTKHRTKP